ncbi:hypothetical protein C0416_02330 [bacterium]|nr:hypothetical protein [bacterium]
MAEEKGPEKQTELRTSSELEKTVKETSSPRDAVTERLFNSISGGQSAVEFIEKACKLSKIEPPKPGEALAPYVYQLQKSLNFPNEDRYDGCDGKLGPITFNALVSKFPVLSPTTRREAKEKAKEGAKAALKDLVQSQGLPAPPKSSEPSPANGVAEKASEVTSITPERLVVTGDSLCAAGYGKFLYEGTDKYEQYHNKYFKSGWSIVTMRKNLEKNCEYADAYLIGAAANDIYYKSVDTIEAEFMKIIEIAMRKNPNAKIVLLTLHGDDYKGWKNSPKVKEKIAELNNRLGRIAYENANIKLIDIRKEIIDAENNGKKMLAPDKLHYSTLGSKAVAGLIKEYLATGNHGKLTDYI